MEEIAPFLVPIVLFVSIAATVILRGPLGKAIGDRIGGRAPSEEQSAETEALHAEVEDLRFRVTEMEERLDFAERMLAQHKERPLLEGDR